jgi:hypothetical protein
MEELHRHAALLDQPRLVDPDCVRSSTALGSSDGRSIIVISRGSSRRQPRAEIVIIALR